MKSFFVLILTVVFVFCGTVVNAGPMAGGMIKFKWEPNVEPDLFGYKIYWGTNSRFSEQAATAAAEKIEAFCSGKSTAQGITTTTRQTDENDQPIGCKESWRRYCGGNVEKPGEDPACDIDLFNYDNFVKLSKEKVEYTLRAIPDGIYFACATAFDKDGNESKYSNEVRFEIDYTSPSIVVNFSGKLTDRSKWLITIDRILPENDTGE